MRLTSRIHTPLRRTLPLFVVGLTATVATAFAGSLGGNLAEDVTGNRGGNVAVALAEDLSANHGGNVALALASSAGAYPVPIEWQHHQDNFAYSGFTTLYSCDGLEGQVRRILTYLGARRDVKVTARGCARGFEAPGRYAWVAADFYVPAASTGTVASTGTASSPGPVGEMGQWTQIDMTPRHPFFMDAGDCELIEDMQALVTKNFDVRDLDYRSSCFPNELSFDGFAVRGQALKVVTARKPVATPGPKS
jgi:hypothetical protein